MGMMLMGRTRINVNFIRLVHFSSTLSYGSYVPSGRGHGSKKQRGSEGSRPTYDPSGHSFKSGGQDAGHGKKGQSGLVKSLPTTVPSGQPLASLGQAMGHGSKGHQGLVKSRPTLVTPSGQITNSLEQGKMLGQGRNGQAGSVESRPTVEPSGQTKASRGQP
jgi:hypothetical protein